MTTELPIQKDTPLVKMEENKAAAKKIKSAKPLPVAKKNVPAAKKTESKVAAKKIKSVKAAPVVTQLAAPAPKAPAAKAAETKVAPKKVSKAKEAPVKSEKKILREAIELSIEKTFPNIKKAVGEKKFNKQVKKASKVLVKGTAKTKK
ncbi:MAG: hypothetical protein H7334_01525 [Ferruginibacter sp.]|nr:hypothetical protein [Ferruginibacter sp.]